MEEIKIEQLEDSVVVTIPKTKDYTLTDLRQKLINYLCNLNFYDNNTVELIKILFEPKRD